MRIILSLLCCVEEFFVTSSSSYLSVNPAEIQFVIPSSTEKDGLIESFCITWLFSFGHTRFSFVCVCARSFLSRFASAHVTDANRRFLVAVFCPEAQLDRWAQTTWDVHVETSAGVRTSRLQTVFYPLSSAMKHRNLSFSLSSFIYRLFSKWCWLLFALRSDWAMFLNLFSFLMLIHSGVQTDILQTGVFPKASGVHCEQDLSLSRLSWIFKG